jgi:hypothetical protein
VTAWTPPPPGSDRDKLPDHLLALIADRMRPYLSTACETAAALEAAGPANPGHGDELRQWAEREHASCRLTRKQDMAPCSCPHHREQP